MDDLSTGLLKVYFSDVSVIQPGKKIMDDLSTGLLKVCFSDASVIQMFIIQIPAVNYYWLILLFMFRDLHYLIGNSEQLTQASVPLKTH